MLLGSHLVMKGPDNEIFKTYKKSVGYQASDSGNKNYEMGWFSDEAITSPNIIRIIAGLSCMALLSIVTVQTMSWSNLSGPLANGLTLNIIVSLISIVGIVVCRFWRLRVG
jgi:hypothetical protein